MGLEVYVWEESSSFKCVSQEERDRGDYRNLGILNRILGCSFIEEDIYKVANSRLG